VFRRLFAAFLALLVLALSVFALLTAREMRERVREEIELRLHAEAELLRALVRASKPEALQDALRGLRGSSETRFTVVAGDGRVLADSHADPASMEPHNGRPELLQARASGVGTNVRHSGTVGYEMMYHARLLDPTGPAAVVVRVALPLTRVEAELARLTAQMAVVFLLVGAAGGAVSYLLARWISRPLAELRETADAVAGGELGRKAPGGLPHEAGALARAMNRMADELKARLESIRGESARLEALIASMEEGVVALDREGRIGRHNEAARRLLGIVPEASGLKLWESVRVPGIEDRVREALARGAPVRSRFEVGPRIVALSVGPVAGGEGALVVARDATEEQRYDQLRKDFVANVSHELRTPLSLVQGFVETLREGAWRDEARAPEFLETIDRNVQRLRALVEDLLELSRLESSGEVVRPRGTDAAALLARVEEYFRPLAAKKSLAFTVEAAAGLVFRADPELLERAVGNLVDNAIKYTPEGGRVTVRAEEKEGAVLLSVEDTGIGIPEADQPRVFERFYRVDKSRSRELGGTGLGLAIVKHVAQLHGGTVSLRSAPGRGSAFILRIPSGRTG
jgi:two-component system phosphate regulon sensor histidine kinase PhoR